MNIQKDILHSALHTVCVPNAYFILLGHFKHSSDIDEPFSLLSSVYKTRDGCLDQHAEDDWREQIFIYQNYLPLSDLGATFALDRSA